MNATKAKARIESVKVVRESDDSPDTSYLGEYTDRAELWAIERESGEYVANLPEDHEPPARGRDYRYFLPYAGGEEQGTEDYQKYGLQDFARMEALERCEWGYLGIYAVAEVIVCGTLQRVRSAGLWGIESDSEDGYFAEVAEEELAQLADILGEFTLSGRAIAAAIKSAERE